MAEKLSWTELRHLLAKRGNISEKEANAFLSSLTAQIIEALQQDKQVKINGLGTFRLQQVAPRRSVNISSGEEMTIEGYNKIAFTPEAGVKELIEKESTRTAAPTETDPLKKLGEQATEIVGLLADLGQAPHAKEKAKGKKEKKAEKAEKNEKKKAQPKKKAASKPVEPEEQPVVLEEPKPVVQEETTVPESTVVPEETVAPEKPKETEKAKKPYRFVRDTLICVVILLLLLLVGYFFLQHQLSNWLKDISQPKPVQTEQVVTEPAAPSAEAAETVAAEPTEEPQAAAPATLQPQPQRYDRLITTEPMHQNSRLAWMAKRYYGSKIYWPYLYDANRDHISNPSHIKVGTPILVPKLTAEQRDTTNAQTMANLDYLRKQAEEASMR